MGKVNKNDYFSLLIKQNLMDTEESVMRTFKANKMKGFFHLPGCYTVELAAVRFCECKMHKADKTKAIIQVDQTPRNSSILCPRNPLTRKLAEPGYTAQE